PGLGHPVRDDPGGGDAVARHGDVEEADVRLLGGGALHRAHRVPGLPAHLEPVVGQGLRHEPPHRPVVVGNEHPGAHRPAPVAGRLSATRASRAASRAASTMSPSGSSCSATRRRSWAAWAWMKARWPSVLWSSRPRRARSAATRSRPTEAWASRALATADHTAARATTVAKAIVAAVEPRGPPDASSPTPAPAANDATTTAVKRGASAVPPSRDDRPNSVLAAAWSPPTSHSPRCARRDDSRAGAA